MEHLQRDKSARGILVVDEDASWANSLVAALVDRGRRASAAHGAAEALSAVEKTHWDLIVVGVKAPGAGGLTLARELRERYDSALVILASVRDFETVREATALGALAYLIEPRDPGQCIPTIETALGRAEDMLVLRQRVAQLASAAQQNRATGVAVGILAERLRLNRDDAFETLRRSARSHRRSVADVAEQVVSAAEVLNQIIQKKALSQGPGNLPAN